MLDVGFWFGVGFIPGVNAVKTAGELLGILPYNFNLFQASRGDAPLFSPQGLTGAAAGVFSANAWYHRDRFRSAIQHSAIGNASEYAARRNPSPKVLKNLQTYDRLKRLVKISGGLSNLFNAVDAASSAVSCFTSCEPKD